MDVFGDELGYVRPVQVFFNGFVLYLIEKNELVLIFFVWLVNGMTSILCFC